MIPSATAVLVSEGAMYQGGEMVFQSATSDAFGHKKLGGIGDLVSAEVKDRSPKYPITSITVLTPAWDP